MQNHQRREPTPETIGAEAQWLRDQGLGVGGTAEAGDVARDLASGRTTREQLLAERAGFVRIGQSTEN